MSTIFDKFTGREFNPSVPLYLITTNPPLVYDRLNFEFVQVNDGTPDLPDVGYAPPARWTPDLARQGLAQPPQFDNAVAPNVIYTPADGGELVFSDGVWVPEEETLVAHLFIDWVDQGPVTQGVIPVLPAWRGKTARIREIATYDGVVAEVWSDSAAIPAAVALAAEQPAVQHRGRKK